MSIDYFIIGTQKSGTSSLKYYLSAHPEVVSQKQLECAFFHDVDEFERDESFLNKKYFYHINHDNNKRLLKHSTAIYFDHELKMISSSSILDNCQFIITLRNPIERFISAYLMEVERSGYSKSCNEAIKIALEDKKSFEYRSFYSYGFYLKYITQLYKFIPKERVHIVIFEEMKENPIQVIKELCSNLGLDFNKFNQSIFNEVRNELKVSKSKRAVRFLVFMKYSSIIRKLKGLLSPNFKNRINEGIESLLFKPLKRKRIIERSAYTQLKALYKKSIIDFEKEIGIKTSWLNQNQ